MTTGGHGLTLNEATYSIFYENKFNYIHRQQAEDRNHRIGQIRRPTYIDMASRSKIEERIFASLRKKGNTVDDFRRTVQKLKEMGRDEVRKYLKDNL